MWWGSTRSVPCVGCMQRMHWQCCGCRDEMYGKCFAGPTCLPHVLHSCAVEASKAKQALPQKSTFPGNYRVSWAVWHGSGWVNSWSCRLTQKFIAKVYVLLKHLELSGIFKGINGFENAQRYVLSFIQYPGKQPDISGCGFVFFSHRVLTDLFRAWVWQNLWETDWYDKWCGVPTYMHVMKVI